MDMQSMATAMLQKYGAPLTPENMSAAMQELQSNPASQGAALGLQGGAGESGYDASKFKSSLSSNLDKLAADGRSSGNASSIQAPLPQAPLPENMNNTYSPAPVTANKNVTIPATGSGRGGSGGNPNVEPPSASIAALNELVNNTSRTNDVPRVLPGEAEGGGNAPSGLPGSLEDYALALGIPVATAAVGYAAYEALDNNAKINHINQIKAELDADPSRKGLKNYGGRTDVETTKAPPLEDASKARATELEALKAAEKPQLPPPFKADAPGASIKDAPYTPAPQGAIPEPPKGPVEAMPNNATKNRKALQDALKKARPRL